MSTGTWEWLPIEQAPKDRPILVIGGKIQSELGDPKDYSSPVKVRFDDDSYWSADTCRYESRWNVEHTCHYGVWVAGPTHFCELPPLPEVG